MTKRDDKISPEDGPDELERRREMAPPAEAEPVMVPPKDRITAPSVPGPTRELEELSAAVAVRLEDIDARLGQLESLDRKLDRLIQALPLLEKLHDVLLGKPNSEAPPLSRTEDGRARGIGAEFHTIRGHLAAVVGNTEQTAREVSGDRELEVAPLIDRIDKVVRGAAADVTTQLMTFFQTDYRERMGTFGASIEGIKTRLGEAEESIEELRQRLPQ